MTTGALIFAVNNEHIDYVAMATWSARNIQRHLNIPVAVVTTQPIASGFDQVIVIDPVGTNERYFSDYAANVTWHNESRTDAYALSPWDQTLVLDADYVVSSSQLKVVLDANQDFLAHRWAYDATGINDFTSQNYFGNYCMPMTWATVMMFRRSQQAKLIFDSMQMIKNNWTHYRNLYHNTRSTYRNDHALSIALNITNGHTLTYNNIPWNLTTITPDCSLSKIGQDRYRVDFVTANQKPRWIELHNQDFHAMGKKHLGEIVANSC